MFSDAHNRLHFSIIASPPIQNNSNNKNTITYIKWNSDKAENFTRHVHLLTITMVNRLNSMLDDVEHCHT